MIAHLEPLHIMVEEVRSIFPFQRLVLNVRQGPKTARETSFAQVFGRDLHEAREACRRYRIYGEIRDLEKAWEIYYGVRRLLPPRDLNAHFASQVFTRIKKQLESLTTLDLQFVSPELLKARNLNLAVPGLLFAESTVVRVTHAFNRNVPSWQACCDHQQLREQVDCHPVETTSSSTGNQGKRPQGVSFRPEGYVRSLHHKCPSPLIAFVRSRGSSAGRASDATLQSGEQPTVRGCRLLQEAAAHPTILCHSSRAASWSLGMG